VFNGTPRWLDIGVRTNGGGAFTTLTPRQELTASPYAVTAGNVTGPINGSAIVNGSIGGAKLANGAVGASQLASNSITASQLAPGAAAENLGPSSQSGIASGGLVLSPTDNAALVAAGYVKIGTTQLGDGWFHGNNGDAPAGRILHSAVWTGSEMLIWGGFGTADLGDGARYNPVANTWRPISTTDAPLPRREHSAIWTGTEMIVWGGFSSAADYQQSGGRYDPATDRWQPTATTGAPAGRYEHSVVWTGSEMIVWGGYNGSVLNDGARYSPVSNAWRTVFTSGAPGARQ